MYDFIIDVTHSVWRNGFSLTALGAVFFVILRQRKVKRKLKKLVPMLFSDDSEVKEYVQNQVRIESKLDALLLKEGVVWVESGDTKKSWTVQTACLKKRSLLSQVAFHRKGKWRMKDFLTGKKKWLAFLLAVLINGLNETLGLGIDADTVSNITTGATGYIVVEGVLDFTRSITNHLKAKGEPKNAELNIPIEPTL